MAYAVETSPRVERDLALLFTRIHADSSVAAWNWYKGLRQAIRSLANQPDRAPVTPETNALRHLLYGRRPHVYRVIFRIVEQEKRVEVLHIRHGAMRAFRVDRLIGGKRKQRKAGQ